MRSRGLAHAPLTASEENDLGPAHKTLRSKASSMICWADTTLPSSRVRSDALRTNLFKRALLGRRVMGTVSGSLVLAFLAFERAGAGAATGALAGGVEDTKTGADAGATTGSGAEVLPAGWLAAAAIRAANSLESRFFFMQGPVRQWCDGAASQYRDCATLQLHAVTSARHHSILPSQRCNSTTLQPCGGTVPWHRGVSTLRCHTATALQCSEAGM